MPRAFLLGVLLVTESGLGLQGVQNDEGISSTDMAMGAIGSGLIPESGQGVDAEETGQGTF